MSEANPLQRPATRAARLSAVEEALLKHVITSQSQLSQILADEDIEVTQATLSRDLDELGAVKTRLADGTVAYTIGGRQQNPAPACRGQGRTADVTGPVGLVTSVASAGNLIVVHTPSGAAQYVASVIGQTAARRLVLGTIAGRHRHGHLRG